eukprot:TRINITY_DN917_c0_g1_i1.p1 TRINITY_DN917_c0_g1~~TRINITY_DN917_c0_g1_i1.p1  ORF type:complete len:245 (-),score=72.91 TRINITY_DN917_c0_g1_i1:114-848(-)
MGWGQSTEQRSPPPKATKKTRKARKSSPVISPEVKFRELLQGMESDYPRWEQEVARLQDRLAAYLQSRASPAPPLAEAAAPGGAGKEEASEREREELEKNIRVVDKDIQVVEESASLKSLEEEGEGGEGGEGEPGKAQPEAPSSPSSDPIQAEKKKLKVDLMTKQEFLMQKLLSTDGVVTSNEELRLKRKDIVRKLQGLLSRLDKYVAGVETGILEVESKREEAEGEDDDVPPPEPYIDDQELL